MSLRISTMGLEDVSAVASLSGQLGYPCTADQTRSHFETIRATPGQQVFVARVDNKVVGWLHVYTRLSLSTGPRCELGGLVVDENHRGKGIGTQLIAAAEEWAKQEGLSGVVFSSRVTRTEAHRLYERRGYKIQKTSHVFAKRFGE